MGVADVSCQQGKGQVDGFRSFFAQAAPTLGLISDLMAGEIRTPSLSLVLLLRIRGEKNISKLR